MKARHGLITLYHQLSIALSLLQENELIDLSLVREQNSFELKSLTNTPITSYPSINTLMQTIELDSFVALVEYAMAKYQFQKENAPDYLKNKLALLHFLMGKILYPKEVTPEEWEHIFLTARLPFSKTTAHLPYAGAFHSVGNMRMSKTEMWTLTFFSHWKKEAMAIATEQTSRFENSSITYESILTLPIPARLIPEGIRGLEPQDYLFEAMVIMQELERRKQARKQPKKHFILDAYSHAYEPNYQELAAGVSLMQKLHEMIKSKRPLAARDWLILETQIRNNKNSAYYGAFNRNAKLENFFTRMHMNWQYSLTAQLITASPTAIDEQRITCSAR